MLKNSNFDNEFTLSPSEINDYYQEGFVVKDKVFNDNDFNSFREGITKSIQNKCDDLINQNGGMLPIETEDIVTVEFTYN